MGIKHNFAIAMNNNQLRRFAIAWIIASITMFSMSYVWHGVVLNDYSRLSIPVNTYLTLASIVYLVLGLALMALIALVKSNRGDMIKGSVVGITLGFFTYLIAFVLGVSFHSSLKLEHTLLDFIWQMIEQGVGGFVAGFVYDLLKEIKKIKAQ